MKTWRIEIEVQVEDAVTAADMQEVADKIADDATLRICDEIEGQTAQGATGQAGAVVKAIDYAAAVARILPRLDGGLAVELASELLTVRTVAGAYEWKLSRRYTDDQELTAPSEARRIVDAFYAARVAGAS